MENKLQNEVKKTGILTPMMSERYEEIPLDMPDLLGNGQEQPKPKKKGKKKDV